jgi:hypothetical protein
MLVALQMQNWRGVTCLQAHLQLTDQSVSMQTVGIGYHELLHLAINRDDRHSFGSSFQGYRGGGSDVKTIAIIHAFVTRRRHARLSAFVLPLGSV